jgi:hypothetical protein
VSHLSERDRDVLRAIDKVRSWGRDADTGDLWRLLNDRMGMSTIRRSLRYLEAHGLVERQDRYRWRRSGGAS